MLPHQCLGSVWSRRDKSRDRDAASVVATIEQFNAVSYRVISTVLMEPDAKSSSRAKVISKWVDIAQVNNPFKFPALLLLNTVHASSEDHNFVNCHYNCRPLYSLFK